VCRHRDGDNDLTDATSPLWCCVTAIKSSSVINSDVAAKPASRAVINPDVAAKPGSRAVINPDAAAKPGSRAVINPDAAASTCRAKDGTREPPLPQ